MTSGGGLRALLLGALALGAAGCQQAAPGPTSAQPQDTPPPGLEAGDATRYSHVQARALIADRTVRTYGAGHGTQIEYFAPDGTAYLWYPGNGAPVPSRWTVRSNDIRHHMCFRYPPRSHNPVIGEYGGRWHCRDFGAYFLRIAERRDSDIFGLASGRQPFVLDRAPTTFDVLLQKTGGAAGAETR